jgi:hypothetical protein
LTLKTTPKAAEATPVLPESDLEKRIKALASSIFRERERAQAELSRAKDVATVQALEQALAKTNDQEVIRRIKSIQDAHTLEEREEKALEQVEKELRGKRKTARQNR